MKRRSISIPGAVYDALYRRCQAQNISIGSCVEGQLQDISGEPTLYRRFVPGNAERSIEVSDETVAAIDNAVRRIPAYKRPSQREFLDGVIGRWLDGQGAE